MTDYYTQPGYTPEHRSPAGTFANAFGLTIGFLVLWEVLAAVGRFVVTPWRRLRAVQMERAYRTRYRAVIAEVATPDEMRLLGDDATWDHERSYAVTAMWNDVVRRWCAANPAEYPSQSQMRASGFLCRCHPTNHTCCDRGAGANLSRAGIWTRRSEGGAGVVVTGSGLTRKTYVDGKVQRNWKAGVIVAACCVAFTVFMMAFAIWEESQL